ncbi:MAG: thioredoxin domain-containing protein [Acidobacteria bacterium]|nr:thioredoxin domain-containing protein [Acidobacteriota bacterium]
MNDPRPSNHLAQETSPYLLQHAHNPVDWHPWGPAALEAARREDKPILLSIGYAACHWCHVMERESFEDEQIAAQMNEGFICIKVDREERPDLDDIYMTAVQMMSGHGGWPLTVFLTPDLKPFFGGTYFPPEDRVGMPGFRSVLEAVRQSYDRERDHVEATSNNIVENIEANARRPGKSTSLEILSTDLINAAVAHYRHRFEPIFGGFSPAPKFPHPMAISLLLRYVWHHGDAEVLHMATLSLDRMAYGGMYDQLGGGFHRYSTDDRWLVPHFEKMLYDNALLATAYLEAVQLTGHEEYRRVATETLDWAIGDMQSPAGGYYSTVDADSEGEEGRFYVWQLAEIQALLGEQAAAFCTVYDVTNDGNWEGTNILNLSRPAAEFFDDLGTDPEALESSLAASRSLLLRVRDQRVHPGLDDKILTDWNGLMIAAMARGYRVLGEERFLESARRAAAFALGTMTVDGRLLHSHRDNRTHLLAYIDDHANLLGGLIELFEATFELEWLRQARVLADRMIELFWDDDAGCFFFAGTDHEELIARMKPGHDGATPSGNAVAANALLRLQALTGEESYGQRASDVLHAFHTQMKAAPSSFAHMIAAIDYYLRSPREIALIGDRESREVSGALRSLWGQFRPHDLIVSFDPASDEAAQAPAEIPLLAGKKVVDQRPTFYVCENYACQAPTHDVDEVIAERRR